jgi:hypothetical protein
MIEMKSTRIVSGLLRDGYERDETNGLSAVFSTSQLFPARDGTWLMVDWIELESGHTNWYVTEGVM